MESVNPFIYKRLIWIEKELSATLVGRHLKKISVPCPSQPGAMVDEFGRANFPMWIVRTKSFSTPIPLGALVPSSQVLADSVQNTRITGPASRLGSKKTRGGPRGRPAFSSLSDFGGR